MIVFLDTEFTDLVAGPLLLSIGIVAGGSNRKEFYGEVTDEDRLRAASPYARRVVLPQFGRIAGAACSYPVLCGRICRYFAGLSASLKGGETIDVAFESDFDWTLIERAFQLAGFHRRRAFRALLRPANVYDITGWMAGERAAEAYFEQQLDASISRHHALCDARALRIAYEADTASTRAAESEHTARPSATRPVLRPDPPAAIGQGLA